MSYQLVWFRTDLRTLDHPALWAATQSGPTLAVYWITPQQWQQHADAPCKLAFWQRNLRALAEQLKQLNIPLWVRECPDWQALPEAFTRLCQQHAIAQLHFNEECGLNEQRRDQAVEQHLTQAGVLVKSYPDHLLFAPERLRTQAGQPFQVYTPFRNQCHRLLSQALPSCWPRPRAQAPLPIASDVIPEHFSDAANAATVQALWPVGEEGAHQRLNAFVTQHLSDYKTLRDLPAQTGTSQLSPYLTAGVLSARQCIQAALALTGGRFATEQTGFITWIDELLWREFYRHILTAHPRLSMGYAFKRETERIPWRHDPEALLAWQQGQTGLPLIDAAMRCLQATGWMHNRLRMITAMFLTKNLLIDWRQGERWFMQHLIDGDLAQNNGGWQWCASTGTDAVPYFRIFNPITQSQKWDPQGEFIRQWVPELANVASKNLHDPTRVTGLFPLRYPKPLVDLPQSRRRALQAFQNLSAP